MYEKIEHLVFASAHVGRRKICPKQAFKDQMEAVCIWSHLKCWFIVSHAINSSLTHR